MSKIIIAFAMLLPFVVFAQKDSILSGMYSWSDPKTAVQKNILSTVLFEGKVVDMEFLQMNANALVPSREASVVTVPGDEEHLLLLKGGKMLIRIADSAWKIGGGSIALLMPGQKYTLQNQESDTCTYYLMKYRSRQTANGKRGQESGGSIVKDWNQIVFKQHDRGGSRNYFERPTAMCKRMEMHATTLKEGIRSHEPHTHKAEEIILVIDNKTEMQVGERFFKGGAGTIYYLGSNVPHAIKNDGVGNCIYFAFQFE